MKYLFILLSLLLAGCGGGEEENIPAYHGVPYADHTGRFPASPAGVEKFHIYDDVASVNAKCVPWYAEKQDCLLVTWAGDPDNLKKVLSSAARLCDLSKQSKEDCLYQMNKSILRK